MSGAFFGGMAGGISSGIRDVRGLQEIKIADDQNARAERADMRAQAAEGRAATRFGVEQTKIRNVQAAHRAVAETYRSQIAAGTTSTAPGLTASNTVGVEPSPASAPSTGMSTPATNAATAGTPPSSRPGGVTDFGLTVEAAQRIYASNPNDATRQVLESAYARQIADRDYRDKRMDQSYVNRLREAQAKRADISNEAATLQIKQARTQMSVQEGERARQSVEDRAKFVSTTMAGLDPKLPVTDPRVSARTEQAMKVLQEGLNTIGTPMGASYDIQRVPGGYSVVRVDTDTGKIMGAPEKITTVADVNKFVATAGVITDPENFAKFQINTAHVVDTESVRRLSQASREAEVTGARITADQNSVSAERMARARAALEKITELKDEGPFGIYKNLDEIIALRSEVSGTMPNTLVKVQEVVPDGQGGSKVVTKMVDHQLQRLVALRENLTVTESSRNGSEHKVYMPGMMLHLAATPKDAEDTARKALNIRGSDPLTPEQIIQGIDITLRQKGLPSQAQQYLLSLFSNKSEEFAKLRAKVAATPQGMQVAPSIMDVTGVAP